MKRIFSISNNSHSLGTVFFTWQKGSASYLVTTGLDSCVNVFDRHGEKVDQINLPGYCTGVAWDSEGDVLGIITDRSPCVILWDANTHRIQQVDTGVRDALTLILWAKSSSPLLAVGTSKGNLLIYNHRTARKIPILGKHTKKITSGAWSDTNMLALVGEDKVLTISNEEGDNMAINTLKGEAAGVQFAYMKLDDKPQGLNSTQNCVSLIVNKKHLYLLNLSDSENPIQLTFQDRYGLIVDYQWFADGLILIGFTSGIFIVVSTYFKEIGQELSQYKAHKEGLSAFNVCLDTKKLASCSENNVKVCDLNDLSDVQSVLTIDDEQSVELLEWSDDGQLLAMVSPTGTIHVYLSKLTILGDSFGTRLAFLSSLLEVTVFNVQEDLSDSVIIIRINVEPSLEAVGPYHAAVAMNNRVWFYTLTDTDTSGLLREREYIGIVKCLKLNGDYAAALFTNGTLHLHLIENEVNSNDNETRDLKSFPESSGSSAGTGRVTTLCLTNDFLIFATDSGSIEFFMLEDWVMVGVYRHTTGIKMISANVNGIRVAIIDDCNDAYIYNSVTDVMIQISQKDFPTNTKTILWESWPFDKGVFIACDPKFAYVFVQIRDTIDGPAVEYIGKMKIPSGQYPLLLYNGVVVCQTQSGKTSNFVLSTHDFNDKMNDRTRLKTELLRDILKLRRYQDSWKICQYLNDRESWDAFGRAVIQDMDLDLAIRIYRHIEDSGFVQTLRNLKSIEERNLLAGHLAVCCDRHDLAQPLYLSSSHPSEALEMRQNLLQWSEALTLTNRLAPKQIPIISREFATQLEFTGDYARALDNYEKGLVSDESQLSGPQTDAAKHNQLCKAGIARNAIRCGNTRRGIEFASQLSNKAVLEECAAILDSLKLFSDAALLYEKCENYEKAANLYMKVKNYNKVSDLLQRIDSKEIHFQFAKAKEMEGKYREAVKAYVKAEEWLNVVRLYLDYLNNPGEAVKIVRETKSVEGAKMIAKFFQKLNDVNSAIEFLVMSKCHDEAYRLAQSTNQMDIFANILQSQDYIDNKELSDDFLSIAIHYEQERDALKAGKFYCIAGQYKKGVKFLLQSAANSNEDQSEALRLSIDAAAQSKDEQIIRMIIDYLIGETDGIPNDFKYLFRLYMSLKYYKEAAKTALIIAREEQNAGNYRNAHNLLFGMCQELKRQRIGVPSEMMNSLMLIHSYILIKVWIKVGDHHRSAKLLIKVANNLSRFPEHIVAILTSAVIECQRAGMKRKSLEYATTLMRPEYRDQIDPKFKKKIETLVRKSGGALKEEDQESGDTYTACPFCDNQVVDAELSCHNCRNTIPFCIATGLHVIREDLTVCPNCQFAAIRSHFSRLLDNEPICPMCNSKVDTSQMVAIDDFESILDSDQQK